MAGPLSPGLYPEWHFRGGMHPAQGHSVSGKVRGHSSLALLSGSKCDHQPGKGSISLESVRNTDSQALPQIHRISTSWWCYPEITGRNNSRWFLCSITFENHHTPKLCSQFECIHSSCMDFCPTCAEEASTVQETMQLCRALGRSCVCANQRPSVWHGQPQAGAISA